MEGIKLANRFFWAHLVTTILMCLALPGPIGTSEWLGIAPAKIPGYSWIANVEGVLSFYPDFFLLSWMLLPLWTIAFAVLYSRLPFQPARTSTSPGVVFICAVAVIAFFAFVDIDVSDNTGRSSVLLIVAAQNRILGALVFSAGATAVCVACLAAFVKVPVDAIKGAA